MASKRRRAPLICESCYEPEGFDDMVNCGKCLKWTHFCCGSVGPKIKNHPWQCDLCKAAEMAAVQEDIRKMGMGQKEISKAVADSVAYAEAVQEDVRGIKMGQNEVIQSVKEEMKVLQTVKEEMKVLQTVKEEMKVLQTVKEEMKVLQTVKEEMKVLKSDRANVTASFMNLKEDIHDIKRTIKKVKTENTGEAKPSHRMPTLPAETMDGLQNLLIYVATDDGNSKFKSHISAFCGSDLKKSIRNILFNVMTKDVQKQLSWSGFRTSKPPFLTKFKEIHDAINVTLKLQYKDYNYDIFKAKVSTLLQNA